VLSLIAAGSIASAFALVRVQYEALVRAYWLLYAATDIALERLTGDLSADTVERLPMVAEMLKSMRSAVPPGAYATLIDFGEKSLRPLNSYVHSGGHAYQRGAGGYPERLVRQVVVASNGLQWACAFEVCNLAHDANAAARLYGLRTLYADCLPVSGV
jgi:hypothetical protein